MNQENVIFPPFHQNRHEISDGEEIKVLVKTIKHAPFKWQCSPSACIARENACTKHITPI